MLDNECEDENKCLFLFTIFSAAIIFNKSNTGKWLNNTTPFKKNR